MTSDQSKNTFRPPPPRPPWTYLQTPDVSTSFATYSRTLNQTSTYDSPKTAFPLRRIPPAMDLFFSLNFYLVPELLFGNGPSRNSVSTRRIDQTGRSTKVAICRTRR